MAIKSKPRLRAACLAVISLVATTSISAAWDEANCGQRPPMRYMHEPAQPYTITTLDDAALRVKCSNGNAFIARAVWACAYPEANEIYILDTIPSRMRECTIVHERAHLNGWSYFHEIR